MMESEKEKTGKSYVRSIVAMMNDNDTSNKSPPWVSPSSEVSPRSEPSYLSLAKSNNGYNPSLLYHDNMTNYDTPRKNGSNLKKNEETTEYVSLSQMISPKFKTHSKYTDLGLQLRSPEKNCRSFLRNITSFEQKGKDITENSLTMVGQKMQHLLQPDTKVVDETNSPVKSVPEDEDVPDRVLSPKTNGLPDVPPSVMRLVLEIVGEEERPDEFTTPPAQNAGLHFRQVAELYRVDLLRIADLVDVELTNESRNKDIPEDIQGIIRCASGKARLIVRERFKQFDKLCEQNINPSMDDKIPGPADLAGFWDMVMIEVISIYSNFRDIAKASFNSWQMPVKEVSIPKKSGQKSPKTAKVVSNTKKARNPRRSGVRESIIAKAKAIAAAQAKEEKENNDAGLAANSSSE